MAITAGSATVPSNSTIPVFSLPPGYSNLTVYQPSQAQSVWVGTGPGVTPTTGMIVPVTPLNTETYTGAMGATMYATTGNGTASSFSYILCTAINLGIHLD
jgi:hypothetical protein